MRCLSVRLWSTRIVLFAYLIVSGSDGCWKLPVPSALPAVSGLRDVFERRLRHGIDQVLRDDVAGERILLEPAAADRRAA